MKRPIEPGCMVLTVRCCCKPLEYGLGKPFIVSHIEQAKPIKCFHCEAIDISGKFVHFKDPKQMPQGTIRMAPIEWVIRIDPPENMVMDEIKKELEACTPL